MEKDAGSVFNEFKEDISLYLSLKLRLLKLTATERIAKLIAVLSHGVILVLFIFFATLFFFLSLGFFLGDLLGSTALGFLIVGGIYLLFLFFLFLGKEWIRVRIMNIVIKAIQEDKDEEH